MTDLKIQITAKIPVAKPGDVFVIGAETVDGELRLRHQAIELGNLEGQKLGLLGLSGKPDDLKIFPGANNNTIAVIGLDYGSEIQDKFRYLGGVAGRALTGFRQVVIALPELDEANVSQIIEGFTLGHYSYTDYKSVPKKASLIERLTVVTNAKVSTQALSKIRLLAAAVHDSRNLVNQPANDLFPASFEKHARARVKNLPIAIKVWDEVALVKGGFGGISAVGAGSSRPPRLIRVTYSPRGAKQHLALVGKGITFDTGGLSLKPSESMVGMKYDMTGAAAVLNAVAAASQLGIKTKVTGWLCLAENMPSGTATRPNDVIKARNGKTIEVLNTDAEGRLVLADGLSAASEEYPDLIVDVATLTGAATIALGNRTAGLMGSELAVQMVQNAAKASAEPIWHMPLPAELRPLLDSDIADIANVKIGNRAGGMLIGGLFLREFIGSQKNSKDAIEWAHLDIAGPSDNSSSAYGYTPKGATGTMVRTLVELIKQMAS